MKDGIDELAESYKILEMIEMDQQFKECEETYEMQKDLISLDQTHIWNVYHEVFKSDYQGDKSEFNQDNMNMYHELKIKGLV